MADFFFMIYGNFLNYVELALFLLENREILQFWALNMSEDWVNIL